VLYWMQQSQRATGNAALEHAVRRANVLDKPVVVCFGIDTGYPDANLRHFTFMLQGLCGVRERLAGRDMKFVVAIEAPVDLAARLAADSALVICDRGYLRHQQAWRAALADRVSCKAVQVEADVVVPVDTASDKREWAARTLRKKILQHRGSFIGEMRDVTPKRSSLPLHLQSPVDVSDWRKLADSLDVDRSVGPVRRFHGGTSEARRRLTGFLRNHLAGYADARNDPASPRASELSPYLHFGQISPVELAFKVQRSTSANDDDKEAFLEELIVRRELAANFVRFEPDYDRYDSLPDWARKTLSEHARDKRRHCYPRDRLEAFDTHDDYWNAAMKEMVHTGYMHNYMRMYWGKKILEWSDTPESGYRTLLGLNNRYFLDGRDVNSYANVGWVFGLHDRAWAEREVFGKVRYMSAGGLESKFDIGGYLDRVDELVAAEETAGKAG